MDPSSLIDFPPLGNPAANPTAALPSLDRLWSNIISAPEISSPSIPVSHIETPEDVVHFNKDFTDVAAKEWNLSLVGYSVGKQPFYESLLSTAKRIWKLKGYVYTPWMRSVPAPWMMHSFSTRWTMRSAPSPWMHNTGPRHYRYELPPRMRSSNTNTTRIPSTAADINERAPEQNPQNQSSRAGNRLSKECISNFLINSLGQLTTTEENKICTICQEEINEKENIVILRCNHIYHIGCVKNWFMIKNECAVCRARAIPDENV